jgi:hypothetical protein
MEAIIDSTPQLRRDMLVAVGAAFYATTIGIFYCDRKVLRFRIFFAEEPWNVVDVPT